jgi:hypothetical protein
VKQVQTYPKRCGLANILSLLLLRLLSLPLLLRLLLLLLLHTHTHTHTHTHSVGSGGCECILRSCRSGTYAAHTQELAMVPSHRGCHHPGLGRSVCPRGTCVLCVRRNTQIHIRTHKYTHKHTYTHAHTHTLTLGGDVTPHDYSGGHPLRTNLSKGHIRDEIVCTCGSRRHWQATPTEPV